MEGDQKIIGIDVGNCDEENGAKDYVQRLRENEAMDAVRVTDDGGDGNGVYLEHKCGLYIPEYIFSSY